MLHGRERGNASWLLRTASRMMLILLAAFLTLGLMAQRASAEITAETWFASYHGEENGGPCWLGTCNGSRFDFLDGPPNFDWGTGTIWPGIGLLPDHFSAEFTGNPFFQAGTYEFTTVSDDGVKLWVDGQLIIDNWTDHAATTDKASIDLTAGRHPVKMSYYEKTGYAVAKLSWRSINLFPVFTESAANTSQEINEGQGLAAIVATDPDGEAVTYSLTSGHLPPGISLSANGSFSGKATYQAAGTYEVIIEAADSKGGIGSAALTVTVANLDTKPVLGPLPSPMTSYASNKAHPTTLWARGADADGDPLQYSATGLPPGFSLNPSTGAISGSSPLDSVGTYNVTVTVSDNTPSTPEIDSDTRSFVWQVVRADLTPPTITITARTPEPNQFGWNNGTVTLHFTCEDGGGDTNSCAGAVNGGAPVSFQCVSVYHSEWFGGYYKKECTGSLTVTEERSVATVTAVDYDGNSGTSTFPIHIDKTPPIVTGVVSGPSPSADGWYRGPVRIFWSASDTLSGVRDVYPRESWISGEGANLGAYAQAVDRAGNWGTGQVTGIKIDSHPPVTTATVPPSGWLNTALTLNPTDALSGVKATYYRVDGGPQQSGTSVSLSDGTHTVQFWSVDKADNTEQPRSITVKVDQTAPTLTTQFSAPDLGPVENAHAFNQPVTVQFTCQDDLSGVVGCPDPVLYGDGRYQLALPVIRDAAGNASSEQRALEILVDSTPPTVTGAATSAPNAEGWYNGDVTIHWTAVDELSGVPNPPGDSVITGEGDGLGASAVATDRLGNQGTGRVNGIKIDRTAPTVTYSGNAGTYTVDQMIHITCSVADNLSGVVAETCAEITGPAYSFAVGSHTYSASATDAAGNTGSASATFTVVVTYDSLSTVTDQFVTQAGEANALTSKLKAAKAAESKGNTEAKANQLEAFANQVRAQSGKALTVEQADILLVLVNQL